MKRRVIALSGVMVVMSGCDSLSKGPYATAQLNAENGSAVWGRVSFHQAEGKTFIGSDIGWSAPVASAIAADTAGKIFIRADVNGLSPNRVYIVALNERGDCSGGGAPVGAAAPAAAIALPKLAANGEGTGMLAFTTDAWTVSAGPRSVVGRAIVIREQPQEILQRPAATPGAVIACGVIREM